MPHYKNGTLAKHGDLVVRVEPHKQGTELIGIVAIINVGESCSAQVLPLAVRQKGAESWLPMTGSPPNWCVTLSECTRLFDAHQPLTPDLAEQVTASAAAG